MNESGQQASPLLNNGYESTSSEAINQTTSKPSNAIAADSPPTQQQSASKFIETVIKLTGLAGAVSAVMGFPSVLLHFQQLGIPTQYIDYQTVLSAGILPTVVLVTFGLYFLWGVLPLARGNNESAIGLVILIPLILPILPVLILGTLAYYLLILWGIMWLLWSPFRWLGVVDLTNREILILLLCISGTLIGLGLRYRRKIIEKFFSFRARIFRDDSSSVSVKEPQTHSKKLQRSPKNTRTPDQKAKENLELLSPESVGEPQSHSENLKRSPKNTRTPDQKAKDSLKLLPLAWFVVPVLMIVLLFAIKGVLFLWEPSMATILPLTSIVWAGIGLGFMYGLFISCVTWNQFFECKDQTSNTVGLSIAIFSLLLSICFIVVLYSTQLYPVLNQAWGGGKPESVIIWIDEKNLPPLAEMHRQLPKTDVTKEGTIVKIKTMRALRVGSNMILLSSSEEISQGVALPIESVKLVAWEP